MKTLFKLILLTSIICFGTYDTMAQWQGPGVTGAGNIYITGSNVGIGTSSPTNILHLERSGNAFLTIKSTSTNGSTALFGPVSSNGKVETQLQYENEFGIRDNSVGQWRLKILSNGFVGIGMTNPQEVLHINGNLRGNQSGAVRIKTATGYVDIGSKNANWAHFQTDRDKIFLQKSVALGEGILSSHNTKNLYLKTGMTSASNGNTRLTILNSNGNVGIGTVSPEYKLDVNGTVRFSDNLTLSESKYIYLGNNNNRIRAEGSGDIGIYPNANFYVGAVINGAETKNVTFLENGNVGIGTTNLGTYKFVIKQSASLPGKGMQILNAAGDKSAQLWVGSGGAVLDAQQGANFQIRTDDVNRLYIKNSNGNVGIGTVDPSFSLEVEKSNATNNTEYLLGAFNHSGNGGGVYMGYVGNGTEAGKARLRSGGNIDLTLGTTAYHNAIVIKNTNGNVGIGTTDTHGFKLAVAGNIITEEVQVQLEAEWPDYVFSKDYRLASLEETESFIKTEGHLPNIPPAKEVAEKGIAIGDMNAKLLEKIEELTLHLIEMKKENNEMMKSMRQMERKIIELDK